MASTSRPHGQGTAQRPADRLWEHQLRRENKALLEQIKEIGKRREADYAESERKRQETEERLDAIETKLTGFGHELREAVRASEKTATELRTAFSRLGERIGGRAANEPFGENTSSRQPNMHKTPAESTRHPPAPPKMLGSIARSGARPRPIFGVPLQFPPSHEPLAESDNPFVAPPRQNAPRPEKQAAMRRPVTRSTQRVSPEPVDAIPAPSVPKLPRLMQGTMSFKAYYQDSTKRLQAIHDNKPQLEIDFINNFIRGITENKNRQKLMDDLSQIHPSKRKANGTIEILCEWDEVQEGLRRVGLWDTGTEKESKKRKRILPTRGEPRGMVETSL